MSGAPVSSSEVARVLERAAKDGFDNAEVFCERTEATIWEKRAWREAPHRSSKCDAGLAVRVWAGDQVAFSAVAETTLPALQACYAAAAGKISRISQPRMVSVPIADLLVAEMALWHQRNREAPDLLDLLCPGQLQGVQSIWAQVLNRIQEVEIFSLRQSAVRERRIRSHIFMDLATAEHQLVERAIAWSGPAPSQLDARIVALKRECCQIASERRDRMPVSLSAARVVLGEQLGATFFHEIVGHLSEAHPITSDAHLWPPGVIGAVQIADDPTVPGGPASQCFDDEGTPTSTTTLLSSGIADGAPRALSDYNAHRRRGLPLTGSARRESYRKPVLARMSNLIVRAPTQARSQLLKDVGTGVYVNKVGHALIEPRTNDLVIEAREAYLIEGGVLTAPLLPFVCHLPAISALRRVQAVVADPMAEIDGVWCEKFGSTVPVGIGRASVVLEPVEISPGTLTSAISYSQAVHP